MWCPIIVIEDEWYYLKCFELRYRIPFDWKSPTSYITIVHFQLIGIVCCSEVCVIVLCLYTGLCIAMTAFVSDIKLNLNRFDDALSTNEVKNIEIMKNLYEIIDFHWNAKKYLEIHFIRLTYFYFAIFYELYSQNHFDISKTVPKYNCVLFYICHN